MYLQYTCCLFLFCSLNNTLNIYANKNKIAASFLMAAQYYTVWTCHWIVLLCPK